ncbi:site-specific integrase [Deltaproteobacteria bacterium IMCC39524]|nr:site-specific integrase [Deltaproteobacteria bacterium IMCC39524]
MAINYLVKRNQTYYYRIKIPTDLTHLIPSKEIKLSLKTRNLDAAKLLAASVNAKIQSLFGLLRAGVIEDEQIPALIASYLPRKQRLKVVATVYRDTSKVNLTEAIRLFVADKSPRWTTKTKLEFECMFDMLVVLLGNKDLSLFTRADGLDCRAKLMRLPSNLRNKGQYKDMSVKQILEAGAEETLTAKTINKYLVLLSSLFKWCVMNGIMTSNIAEGLSLPQETAAHEQRKAYNLNDLKRIATNLPRNIDTPEKFWIPLIAMHSGMRLDECCQLHVEDIKEVDDILCFDINDGGERKVKTKGSKRLIPVHPLLLDIGFRDYLKGRVATGSAKLWENLEPNKYGSWGKKLGNWYGRFNRRHVTQDPKKVFHSFRHTVADTLKQKGVDEAIIAEILGHSNSSITTGRYGKRYRPGVLLEALRQLDYTLDTDW